MQAVDSYDDLSIKSGRGCHGELIGSTVTNREQAPSGSGVELARTGVTIEAPSALTH